MRRRGIGRGDALLAAQRIAEGFDLGGKPIDVRSCGHGLINDTYRVITDRGPEGGAILQRINPRVFPEPVRIMVNLRALLTHVGARQGAARGTAHDLHLPAIFKTLDGADYRLDEEGALWRAVEFIPGTFTTRTLENRNLAGEAGFALGRFHSLTRDLSPDRLRPPLPGFHDTAACLERFTRIAGQAGATADTPTLRYCLRSIEARRAVANVLEVARAEGQIGLRVVHGDPKLDNILFDSNSRRAVSIIDLDTVMPGLIHHDIADCLRSCCNTAGESPEQPERVEFDIDVCRAVLEGYAGAGGLTGEREAGYLYDAIRIIPLELGMRFLTDYLEGNRYFKVSDPEENLRRAITQFRLTDSVERSQHEIREIIDRLTGHQTGG
jgi:Ser/Thr protein kinase RdoA (MazF antagonist)